MEEEFFAFVAEKMVPVWRSFPGLVDLKVSTATLTEDGISYPLHTTFAFPSEDVLKAALASPQRQEALARTKVLLEMFEGRVFHILTRPLVVAGQTIGS
jgi:antibiotic biosynthesis monooxygenase (ABM) superfamily enzyme